MRSIIGCLSAWAVVSSLLVTQAAETTTTELGRHVREHLILHAKAKGATEKNDAILSLCDLYVVLRSDARYSSSEMLQGDAAKLRRRLLSVVGRLERQLKHEGIERPPTLSSDVDRLLRSISLGNDSSDSNASSDDGGFSAGGGRITDTGWGLVELIKRIIAPDFWSDRGGNGTIQYFAMSRALVIRATTDVHQQIEDLLNALR
ncbi:MAG: hypothetical protein AAGJ83_05150 [Planctomycetota bacterium]